MKKKNSRNISNEIKALWRGKPISNLMKTLISQNGRNISGKITVRRIGGGLKNRYRLIDYSRSLIGVPGVLLRLERDPNRNIFIALICYFNGLLSYIVAPKNLNEFKSVITSFSVANVKGDGNVSPLFLVPSGQFVYNIENRPFFGSQYSRAGGSYAQVIGSLGKFVVVKLNSGLVRLFYGSSLATYGVTSKIYLKKKNAGTNRLLGQRPSVRGVAMNPIDHPHGGGQGKTSGGRPSVSPWARFTKGGRTRKKVKKWWVLSDPTTNIRQKKKSK